MHSSNSALKQIQQFALTAKRHWYWVAGCVVVATAAATGYGLLQPEVWEATQSLTVREEATGNAARQGRFDSTDSRKTAQETVLEIARNPSVVAAALAKIGPPPGRMSPGVWPAPGEVQAAIGDTLITAPKGSEFGRSELIYLHVRQHLRSRAIDLATALCEQVDLRLRQLRQARAESLIGELERLSVVARADLDAATRRLQAVESEVGSDLGELRTLTEAGTGDGNLRQAMNKIKEEIRQARATRYTQQQQLDDLKQALRSPDDLAAISSQILEAQPTLRRLKEGLAEAQLQTAHIMGKMSEEHPATRAAIAAEAKIRADLRAEVLSSVQTLESNLRVTVGLEQSLEQQLADVSGRLDRLAQMRARYANLVAAARQRSQAFEENQKALSDARADQSASGSASVLSLVDAPQTGDRPLGPGLSTIVAGGVGGGMALGLGLVVLLAPLGDGQGRRWSDFLPGRRSSDRQVGRRNGDVAAAGSGAGEPRRSEAPLPTVSSAASLSPIPVYGRRSGEVLPATPAAPPAVPITAEPSSVPVDRRAGRDRRTVSSPAASPAAPAPAVPAPAAPPPGRPLPIVTVAAPPMAGVPQV